MRKLLLILLCLPSILFSQQKVYNLDKKFANRIIIDKSDPQLKNNRHYLSQSQPVTYKNREFTGCSVDKVKESCVGVSINSLGGVYWRFDDKITKEVKLADIVRNESTHKSCNERECSEIIYYNKGEPIYLVRIWNCGYKSVSDIYRHGTSKWSDKPDYRTGSYNIYYPNNNIAIYKTTASVEMYGYLGGKIVYLATVGRPSRVLQYYTNGNLFADQTYAECQSHKKTLCCRHYLSVRKIYDTKERLLTKVYYAESWPYSIESIRNTLDKSTSILMDSSSNQPYCCIWDLDESLQKYREIDTYTLEGFVDVFLNDCKENGINIKKQNIQIIFEELEGNTIALADGLNLDSDIIVKVDPANWQKSSIEKKWYIIYHELGHDVLNLEHGQAGKMMFNFADREYDWMEFYQDKKVMFDYYKNK